MNEYPYRFLITDLHFRFTFLQPLRARHFFVRNFCWQKFLKYFLSFSSTKTWRLVLDFYFIRQCCWSIKILLLDFFTDCISALAFRLLPFAKTLLQFFANYACSWQDCHHPSQNSSIGSISAWYWWGPGFNLILIIVLLSNPIGYYINHVRFFKGCHLTN